MEKRTKAIESTTEEIRTIAAAVDNTGINVNQLNGGIGLTRVQIAQRAVDRLKEQLQAAEERLNKAILAEAEGGGSKKAAAEAKRIEKAKAVLLKAGLLKE
jgi:uncharacterized protein (DUF3084 family)